MSEEEKQALIEYCEEVQGNNPESSDAYKVISIALAALTAQPARLWNKHSMLIKPDFREGYRSRTALMNDNVIAAIHYSVK